MRFWTEAMADQKTDKKTDRKADLKLQQSNEQLAQQYNDRITREMLRPGLTAQEMRVSVYNAFCSASPAEGAAMVATLKKLAEEEPEWASLVNYTMNNSPGCIKQK